MVSLCLFVCMYISSQKVLNIFPWNLVLEFYTEICRKNFISVFTKCNRRIIFSETQRRQGLQGVISQNIRVVITIAMRTSEPTT
jgi:hypothetical protein